eukprot:CAMPEP_0177787114 /NCGR_PEP_ID=MMETSP0491_2-20121128/21296_1 /TAXON_ID=63592 /ORGANISM="Tetraselmis chuii, Strain PLY429" /LENGTH=206 /DNA_ID=CAMNT_0019308395 /DNA_START=319 /DNA_END=936 /DNA_ORIENTATION=-
MALPNAPRITPGTATKQAALKQTNGALAGLRNIRSAVGKKVVAIEDWFLGDHDGITRASAGGGMPGNNTKHVDNDFDEDLFCLKMYDYLAARDLPSAAHEFYSGNKGGDFEEWLYKYINLDEQRSTIFTHGDYIFEWVNRQFLLGTRAIPDASPSDVRQNQETLFYIVTSRIQWPLPRQGIALADSCDTSVNVIYCGMDPSSVTPW